MTDRAEGNRPAGRSLLRSGVVVSVMTLISRVFGLIRDMVIAFFFGAGAGADTFFLAFRIPNFFRRLFAEGAFSQAFVPVLTEYRQKRSAEDVRKLVNRTAGTLGISLLMITLAGVVGAELVISVFAAGYIYNDESMKFALAVDMLRLTFPYLMLISLTAFAGSILNTFGRFAAPAFTPVLLNLSLILAALYLRDYLQEPAMALAWGVLIAGVAQLSFQLPFLYAEDLLPKPEIGFRDEGVRKIMALMLPAIFGVSVSQINLLVDTLLASFLETGSLSWLYYADRLLELPLALIGIAIATVILPGLSKDHLSDSPEAFSRTLNWSLKLILLLGLPASVVLIALADEMIATLFYRGEMTTRDVSMSGLALAAYGLGLLGHMFVKVLAPGYFSRQDTRTPVRYGVIALLANIILNLALVWHLKHLGLALATSVSAFLNAGLLFQGLRRSGILTTAGEDWLPYLARLVFATLVMMAAILYLLPTDNFWYETPFAPRLGLMLLICLAGGVLYGTVLAATGMNFKKLMK